MVSIYQFSTLLWIVLVVDAQLDVECGKPVGNVIGSITYTGDAVAVVAYSKNNEVCRFTEDTSTATFKLKVGYKAGPGIDCVFEKTSNSLQNYGLRVETRRLHELLEGGDDERFVVECVFTPVKPNIAVKVLLQQKYNPPKFVMRSSGIAAASAISIFLSDILNGRLTKSVAESQIIKIRSLMVAKKNEKGYQPIECTAESIDKTVKLLVLSDGCGTGFPWRYDQGFSMNGLYGDSPTFRMFRIKKNEGVIFKCTFVICPAACNENSCYLANVLKRGRRSAEKKFTRRTRGVKYNSLGLVSHEKSKHVVGADVLAAHKHDAPTDIEVVKDSEVDKGAAIKYTNYYANETYPIDDVSGHGNAKMENQTENTNIFQDSNGYVQGTNDNYGSSGGIHDGLGYDQMDHQTDNLFQDNNGDVEGTNGNFIDIIEQQTYNSGEIYDAPRDEMVQTENISQDSSLDVTGTSESGYDKTDHQTENVSQDNPVDLMGASEPGYDEIDHQTENIPQDNPVDMRASEPGSDEIDHQTENIPQDNPVDMMGASEPGYDETDHQTHNVLQNNLGGLERPNDNLQGEPSNDDHVGNEIHTIELLGDTVHVKEGSNGETATLEIGNGYLLGTNSSNGDKKTKEINGGKITIVTDGKVKDISVEKAPTTN
ncbi:uncharacterized protein LOC126828635 [Patella vulgata]|uniref:uncharacterized protein LOC126828635 n=1 Tax=Patella vulgata TaxID=6465 RepID=UPI0021803227|nr:uncharacterized protein LOC126828635 [Patella vulgata]